MDKVREDRRSQLFRFDLRQEERWRDGRAPVGGWVGCVWVCVIILQDINV